MKKNILMIYKKIYLKYIDILKRHIKKNLMLLCIFFFMFCNYWIFKLKIKWGNGKNDPLPKLEDANSQKLLNFYQMIFFLRKETK